MLKNAPFYNKIPKSFWLPLIIIAITIALIVVVIKLYDQKIEEIKQANIRQTTSSFLKTNLQIQHEINKFSFLITLLFVNKKLNININNCMKHFELHLKSTVIFFYLPF